MSGVLTEWVANVGRALMGGGLLGWGGTSRQCRKVRLDPRVCYVSFTGAKPDHSDMLPYTTVRGEMLIADFDAEGNIIGVELVGPNGEKPCQR